MGNFISAKSVVESLRTGIVWVVRAYRRLRNKMVILFLRAKGCHVAWTAEINPDAVFERSGGQISIGANTFVDKGVIVRALGGSVLVGPHCSINAYSFLSGFGGITIGDSVRIGSHVSIVASNHIFSDVTGLIREQGLTAEGIKIDDDVWIGTGVRILDGVAVARGCVLAAGAVVNQSTESFSIIGGVPGRQIGIRGVARAVKD